MDGNDGEMIRGPRCSMLGKSKEDLTRVSLTIVKDALRELLGVLK